MKVREVQVMVACYNTCRGARVAPSCDLSHGKRTMEREKSRVTTLQIQVTDQRGCHHGSPLQGVCYE